MFWKVETIKWPTSCFAKIWLWKNWYGRIWFFWLSWSTFFIHETSNKFSNNHVISDYLWCCLWPPYIKKKIKPLWQCGCLVFFSQKYEAIMYNDYIFRVFCLLICACKSLLTILVLHNHRKAIVDTRLLVSLKFHNKILIKFHHKDMRFKSLHLNFDVLRQTWEENISLRN